MFVTTSYHPSAAELELAVSLAGRLSCRYVERRQSSLPRLQKTWGKQDILVVTTQGLRFYGQDASEPFFFHPSSAQVRLKRMLHGTPDGLLEAAGVEPGGTVLDCTAGLGSEAILFSWAVGEKGSVTAVECQPVVALLVEIGLATYSSGFDLLDDAMRRVRLIQAHHLDYLRSRPASSADVVYFDPMFRQTLEASALSPLKSLANPNPLSQEAVSEACRVARRRVLMKEQRESGEFERLGFRMILRPHTKIAYGVIDV